MGQLCSICGFKEKPQQQATANVKTHQSQQSHSSSPLVNMTTNLSSSANVIFFLYTEGAIVPEDVTHVRVDPSVAIIPAGAFGGRRQLKEVILPEGLTAIGWTAFYGCNSLEHINFPSTLTEISDSAFMNCASLREVDLSNVKTIITIGDLAFNGCTSMERINFPSTLTDIGDYAFDGCTSLREVDLSNVKTIAQGAFNGCHSLERINLPSTVTAIGGYAFRDCVSLREVKLVGGILDIGVNAFQGNGTALERIFSLIRFQIPSKAFVIETGAYNCRLLTSGTITPSRNGRMVIASKCLIEMSVTDLAEVENRINEIINNREQTRDVIVEQIRALLAEYELVEATTILELALWKAKLDEGDDLNTREECHFTCGAGIIIPIVLSFL